MKSFVRIVAIAVVRARIVPVIGAAQEQERNEGSTVSDVKTGVVVKTEIGK